jgi:uncharacterized protein (TIGR00266 family)
MEYEITNRPADALVEVALEQGEGIVAEPGAMVSYSDGIGIDTGAGTSGAGGLLGTVKNAVLSDESLTHNRFHAERARSVTLTSQLPGDVADVAVGRGAVNAQSGSYIAAGPAVEVDTELGGWDTLRAGEGLTTLQLRGEGPAFLSAFGGLKTVEVTAGEPYTVDTGHLVAWDDGLEMDVHRPGGLKSTVFSEEGKVAEFDGDGRVWLQTRSFEDFVSYLAGRLPSGGGGHVDVDGDEGFEEEGFEE